MHWKEWCWSWNTTTLATWCEELTYLKRPWCWERLKVGGEGEDRGWDGWMAPPTQWTQVWVNSGSWWWTGRPGVLQSVVSQRVRHDWATELNWTDKVTRYKPIWWDTEMPIITILFSKSTGKSPWSLFVAKPLLSVTEMLLLKEDLRGDLRLTSKDILLPTP